MSAPAYDAFLRDKVDLAVSCGFEIDDAEIHPSLLPHQRLLVRWAVRGGRRALFEHFGLGKSRQQLEILRLITRFSNEGELVFDPFGGIGTVPLRALRLGRRGRAVELNKGYFLDSVKYLEAEERHQELPTLFDLEEVL